MRRRAFLTFLGSIALFPQCVSAFSNSKELNKAGFKIILSPVTISPDRDMEERILHFDNRGIFIKIESSNDII